MKPSLRIAIVGYGIAGIAAAIALRRLGCAIDHFERDAVPGQSGAGLLLHPSAIELLAQWELRDAIMSLGAPVSRITATAISGRTIVDLQYARRDRSACGYGIQRRLLFELLRAKDPGRMWLCTSVSMHDIDAAQGVLFSAQGRRFGPYDLIIAADGVNSSLRRALPALIRRDRAYSSAALVAVLDDSNGLMTDRVSMHFDGAQHLSYWPVGRSDMQSPARVGVSIKIDRGAAAKPQTLGPYRRAMLKLCPPLGPILDTAHDDLRLHPYFFRDVTVQRYTLGKLVLIGDAAHSMSPQLGYGARLALWDASALAQSLREHDTVAAALASFDRVQRARILRYQRYNRWITPLFQSDHRPLMLLRDRFLDPVSKLPWISAKIAELMNE